MIKIRGFKKVHHHHHHRVYSCG